MALIRTFFAGLLDWAGIARTLTVSDPLVKARLHRGPDGKVLYILNPTRQERPVVVELAEPVRTGKDAWENNAVRVEGRKVSVMIGDRDVAVLRLQ